MRKIILLIFPIILISGCNDNTFCPSSFCIRKYPNDNYGNWKIICKKAPFIKNTKIPQELIFPLQEIGFLCNGAPYPKASEINLICKNIDKYK